MDGKQLRLVLCLSKMKKVYFIVIITALSLAHTGSVVITGNRVINSGTPTAMGIIVQTISTTNTQAAMAYSAPNNSACKIEVSENSNYIPLVHDVDTTLFGVGTDQDSRSSGLASGRARIFIIGSRVLSVAGN